MNHVGTAFAGRFRLIVAAALFAIAVLAPGCSSDPSSEGGPPAVIAPVGCTDGEPGCIGWQTCPPELEKDPGGAGCREILPAGECAAGTMAVLGERTCAPIGPSTCPAGFEKAASGWGCEAVMPAKACTGSTRDALGSKTCVPVGDCDAPFPPANATIFVDAAFADADLGPTKFRTISLALATAPKGSVIAVNDGTYAEGIEPGSSVTVVGHCPAKVRFLGTGLQVWGVFANKVKDIVVRGVTLEDHFEGARAQSGGTLTITDSVIESPRFTGLIAYQPGSSIKVERVVVRNVKPQPGINAPVVSANADAGGTIELESSVLAASYEAGITATNPGDETKTRSTIRVNRSIIRDTNPDLRSLAGVGLVVSGIATGELTESAIVDSRRIAVSAFDPAAQLDVKRSVLRHSIQDPSGELAGAASIFDGAHATFEDVTMRDHAQAGVVARSKGAITMKRCVVENTQPGADGDFGMGAYADSGGTLAIESSAITGNTYYGVSVADAGSEGTLARVLVQDTKRDKKDGLGRGVNVEFGAKVTMDRVTLLRNGDESLFVRGETKTGKRATAKATRLLVRDTVSRKDGSTGTGISIEMGALFDLDIGAVVRARRAGILVNDSLGEAGSQAEATFLHTIVRDTQAAGDAQSGKGIAIEGAGVASAGKLTMRASSVIGSVQFGIVAANPGGTAVVESCFVGGTVLEASGGYGHGIVATGGSSIIIRATEVRDNQIGLAFNSASGVVASCLIQNNQVGIHVQDGSTLATAPSPPDETTPKVVLVTDDSRFVDNATRIGSGVVPLPTDPLGGSAP
jgi:hypothetical protein